MAQLRDLTRDFFAATLALACHTSSLQERLADAYADHLLQVMRLPLTRRSAMVSTRLMAGG